MGFCPQCQADGALVERQTGRVGTAIPVERALDVSAPPRIRTGIDAVDEVLGDGIVPGSVVLIGGEPGVGKSTLLLQIASRSGNRDAPALVVSAEESVRQVAMRAQRIGAKNGSLLVLAEQDLPTILDTAATVRPRLLVVDSMQTVAVPEIGAATGGVGAVREVAARLIGFAKSQDVAVLLVGHVTKDGTIAGPKQVEHMVDVVVHLEGDAHRDLRFLRGIKNRFGPVHRTGVFEMGSRGLMEVADPSEALVGSWASDMPGTVLYPALDGRRPLLVEIQALVVPTKNAQPRRSVKGLPAPRVHQVLAVLQRHGAFPLDRHDVYVSAMGGVRILEPAVDLPVALAVASSLSGVEVGRVAAWGEVGLTGELRAAPQGDRRRGEAGRIGVTQILCPEARLSVLGDALAAVGISPGTVHRETLVAAS
jgi:DNA repair protein RadA/Sms